MSYDKYNFTSVFPAEHIGYLLNMQFEPNLNEIKGVLELTDFFFFSYINMPNKIFCSFFLFISFFLKIYVFILKYVYTHKYIHFWVHVTEVNEVLSVY